MAQVDVLALTKQQLGDYLSTSVVEGDAVFVHFWLGEMRTRGMLESSNGRAPEGLRVKHSWRGCFPLAAAVLEDAETPLRRLILQLLLHSIEGKDKDKGLEAALSELTDQEASRMISWRANGAEQARHLLALSSDDAAQWLDDNVGDSLPDPTHCTGAGPLRLPSITLSDSDGEKNTPLYTPPPARSPSPPPQPSFQPLPSSPEAPSSSNLTHSHISYSSSSDRSASAPSRDFFLPGPPFRAADPAALCSPAHSSHPVPPSPSLPRLHIYGLPLDTEANEVSYLLRLGGVTGRSFSFVERRICMSVYATVASRADYKRVLETLHNSTVRGHLVTVERAVDPEPQHPFVVIGGLSPYTSAASMSSSGREARCGLYDFRLHEGGIATCRAPSPASAEDAVRFFSGRRLASATLTARWYPQGFRLPGFESAPEDFACPAAVPALSRSSRSSVGKPHHSHSPPTRPSPATQGVRYRAPSATLSSLKTLFSPSSSEPPANPVCAPKFAPRDSPSSSSTRLSPLKNPTAPIPASWLPFAQYPSPSFPPANPPLSAFVDPLPPSPPPPLPQTVRHSHLNTHPPPSSTDPAPFSVVTAADFASPSLYDFIASTLEKVRDVGANGVGSEANSKGAANETKPVVGSSTAGTMAVASKKRAAPEEKPEEVGKRARWTEWDGC
ncbi:hypothetical protein JCM10213v2_005189 [Rhodosporidiobolus nylandii]